MRKSVLLIMMLFAVSMAANAQKFALIDTEYIMKNIPAAQSANEQMQEATKKYQSEVEALAKEAQKMFQDYQAKSSTFSAAQKTKTEDAIVAKEKEAAELKRNYFGPEGTIYFAFSAQSWFVSTALTPVSFSICATLRRFRSVKVISSVLYLFSRLRMIA